MLEISDDYDDYWFFRKYYDPNLPPITRLQVLDFHTYLPEMNLTKVDRTSMSCSLEVRVPLLSKAMIEAAFELPESVRIHDGVLKSVLKDVAYRELPTRAVGLPFPDSVLDYPKRGFGIGRISKNSIFYRNRTESNNQSVYRTIYQKTLDLPELSF